jgi:hypothetical protein
MYQGLAKLAVMKLHVSYPGDTAQLLDCFRPRRLSQAAYIIKQADIGTTLLSLYCRKNIFQ